MKKLITIAAVVTACAMPALAFGQDRSSSDNRSFERREARSERHSCRISQSGERLTMTQIVAKLTQQGFTIREIEDEHGCYEARVIDDKGTSLKLYLDAVTGDIVRRRERG